MAHAGFLSCYNKGCGATYDPSLNTETSCKFHPGVPVFHDALKGWSCCKKRSTDFTEFLNIPGCTTGFHTNEKPAEPEKAQPTQEEKLVEKLLKNAQIAEKAKVKPVKRPSENEAYEELKTSVEPSLAKALEQQMKDQQVNGASESQSQGEEKLEVGTCCKNGGCKKRYEGESSNNEICQYHPGQPIFHEGYKYWSCCNKKTSDFETFLSQVGCHTGHHLWFKKEDKSKRKDCRFDHHETGQFVTITVYSKLAIPEQSSIKANRVSIDINITFDKGEAKFIKQCQLNGVIDPKESSVKMFGSKVEIKLRKAEASRWGELEYKSKTNAAS